VGMLWFSVFFLFIRKMILGGGGIDTLCCAYCYVVHMMLELNVVSYGLNW